MKFLHLRVALASLLGIVYVYAALDSPTVTTPSPATTPCFQPPTSTDPSKWSSNEYIDKNMIIMAASTAIFWMGRVPNTTESVLLKAQDCAITSTHRPDCQRNHDKKLDHKCQQVRMIVERINFTEIKAQSPNTPRTWVELIPKKHAKREVAIPALIANLLSLSVPTGSHP